MLEACFTNPLTYWEVLKDPKVRERESREAIFPVHLDRIRGPTGVGLQEQGPSFGDHEGISVKSRRRPSFGLPSLLRPPVTSDPTEIHNEC